jgi:hypothetical protein
MFWIHKKNWEIFSIFILWKSFCKIDAISSEVFDSLVKPSGWEDFNVINFRLIEWISFLKINFYYCTGDKLWHLQKFLQYITIEFTPSIILLFPLFPYSWNSFHLYTYVPNISTIFILLYSSLIPPLSHCNYTNPPTGPVLLSCSQFL